MLVLKRGHGRRSGQKLKQKREEKNVMETAKDSRLQQTSGPVHGKGIGHMQKIMSVESHRSTRSAE